MTLDVPVDGGGVVFLPTSRTDLLSSPLLLCTGRLRCWGRVASAAIDSTLTSPRHKHHISTNFCYFTVGQIRSDYCGCHLDG